MIEDGTFREDLFYRLNVMPIFLPPLRDRTDDIGELAQYFIKRFAKSHSRTISGLTQETLQILKSYRWPGNIRELENVIERAFIVENTDYITAQSLPENLLLARTKEVGGAQSSMKSAPSYIGPMDFEAFKEQAEKDFIVSALKANKGKINKTVAEANIPKNTLLRKIKKYGINVRDYAQD
jgi:two-component system response regulator AtoC